MNTLNQCLDIARQVRERPGRGPKLTIDWDSVIRLWFECGNQHAIGSRLGVRPGQVSRILRRVGIHAGRGRREPIHKLPMDELARKYREGMSTVDLGHEYGVASEVVRRRLLTHGQQMRKRGEFEKSGPDNPQWKGGKASDRQDREPHRLARRIAEFCLGKRLPTDSVVHHHDEDGKNNHPANLRVFPTAVAHLRYHQQLLKSPWKAGTKEASLLASENGAEELPLPDDLTPLSLDTSRQFPYDARVRVENLLRASGILQGPTVRPRARR